MEKGTYSATYLTHQPILLYLCHDVSTSTYFLFFTNLFPAAVFQIRHFHSQYIKPVNIVVNY